jgi:hypothetical protein
LKQTKTLNFISEWQFYYLENKQTQGKGMQIPDPENIYGKK